MHIGFEGFVVFALYYIVLKALLQFINIEARRNSWHVPAGVSGLLA